MNSKIQFTVFILLSFVGKTIAQKTDYNKIILPSSAMDISIEEKLVQLAWQNNPKTAMSEKASQVAEYDVKSAKWSWLDHIGVQGNLNEFTIDPSSNDRSGFYPRYNFSIGFSLGVFAQQPLAVKKAKVQNSIVQEKIRLLKLQIRSDVLQGYENYKLAKEIYEIQTLATEDSHSNFLLTEERFKNGEEDLKTYNQTLDRYNRQKITSLNAANHFKIAKIRLEELIGLSLEEVL